MGRKRSTTPEDSISLSSSNESERMVVNYEYPKREQLLRVNDGENISSSCEIAQYQRERSERRHRKHHRVRRHRQESSHKEKKNHVEHRDRSKSHRRKHKHREDNSSVEEASNISEKEKEREHKHKHRKHKKDDRHRKARRERSSHSRKKRRRKQDSEGSIEGRSLDEVSSEDNLENSVPPVDVKPEPISDESEEENQNQVENLPERDMVKVEDARQDWGMEDRTKKENEIENPERKQKINMGLSGKLAEDTNTYNGIVIKYSQPAEARKPKRRWRWYIFKGDQELPFLPLHRQSAYLIGRDRKVADIPTDHPSCSKQHSVLQYRLVTYTRTDGSRGRTVKPYIIDLESANGTYVNNKRIDPKRYVELLEKDVVKFGFSSREYVLLHEASKDDEEEIADNEPPELSPVSLLRNL